MPVLNTILKHLYEQIVEQRSKNQNKIYEITMWLISEKKTKFN